MAMMRLRGRRGTTFHPASPMGFHALALPRKKRIPKLREGATIVTGPGNDLCKIISIKYYSILLYHSDHDGIGRFVNSHLDFLDAVSGDSFMLFVATGSDKLPLRLRSLLAQSPESVQDQSKIYASQSEPFSPDSCYLIADAMGIKRNSLPCIVFFRFNRKSAHSIGLLTLENSWFPPSGRQSDKLRSVKEFFRDVFGELHLIFSSGSRGKEMVRFQEQLDKMKSSATRRRYQRELKETAIKVLANTCRRLIKSLPGLLTKAAVQTAKEHLTG